MQVDKAIRRVNRDVVLVWAMHIVIGLGLIMALVVGTAVGASPILLAAIPCTLWVLLAINGVRETRNALQWPMLISSGKLDEAEQQIERTIRGFTILRSVKLLSLHQLSVLKMAQRQWGEALQLSKAIVRHKLPKDHTLQRASMLVLAGAAVQSNQLQDAFMAIGRLRAMPLSLDEQLSLLVAECAYCGKIGAWTSLADAVNDKARMAELLPTDLAAQVQAWLALASKHCNRTDWEQYLIERCQLLVDPARLCSQEPAFRQLWPTIGNTATTSTGV